MAIPHSARLLVNARFRDPLNPAQTEDLPNAMAIENGRIVAVGREDALTAFATRGFVRTDLGGGTVLPGFIDCHAHLVLTGLMDLGHDLSMADRLEDVLTCVAEAARATDPEKLVLGFRLEELNLREKRLPTRDELDSAAPDRAVLILHATCHRCVLNTLGLKRLNVPLGLPGADHTPDGTTLTGVVRDPGILSWIFPAMLRTMDREHVRTAIHVAARAALAAGITTVHALEGGDLTPGCSQVLLETAPDLPMHVLCWNQSMNLAEVKRLSLPRIGGCICADGELDARTAALFEPYSDDPTNDGTLFYSQEQMNDFVLQAHSSGLQIAVHCESERAIEQVVRAMERAQQMEPRQDCRHRIEHFELPTWTQIERMAQAGIVASMQPVFLDAFIAGERMAHCQRLFGPHRVRRLHPYRTILDEGVRVCGGSDSPVTRFNPLRGIAAAVHHPCAEQAVHPSQAISMFTVEAAFAGFEESHKGRLAPDMLADFVVLGQDPVTVFPGQSPTDMATIPILSTWVGGTRHI